jgi:hypothetical protein
VTTDKHLASEGLLDFCLTRRTERVQSEAGIFYANEVVADNAVIGMTGGYC